MATRFLFRFTLFVLIFTPLVVAPVMHARSAPSAQGNENTVFFPMIIQDNKVVDLFVNSFGGNSEFLHVQDDLAYLGHGNQLLVVDVSNPVTHTLRSQVALPGAPSGRSLEIVDGYIYVAANSYLTVLSGANPDELTLVDLIPMGGTVFNMLTTNNLLYLGASNGMQIYDLAEPGSPQMRSQFPGKGGEIFLEGDLVYQNDGSYPGFNILDVSDPDQPTLLGNYEYRQLRAVEEDWAVTFSAGCIFGTCSPYLEIVDVRDPANPVLADTYTWANLDFETVDKAPILLEDNWLYLGMDQLYIFQLSPSGDLIMVSETPFPLPSTYSAAFHLHKDGNILYATTICGFRDACFSVFDVSDPEQPELLANYEVWGENNLLNIQVNQTQAYLLTAHYNASAEVLPTSHTLHIVDLQEPSTPVPRGEFWMPLGYAVESIRVQDGLGYLLREIPPRMAHTGHALRIHDLSKPEAAAPLLSRYDPEDACGLRSFSIVEHIAFVTHGCQPMSVMDLSFPTTPRILHTSDLRGKKLLARDHRVYMTSSSSENGEVVVMDASNLEDIQTLSYYAVSPENDAYIFTLALNANRLFLGLNGEMEIVDVSQPISPTRMGTYTIQLTVTSSVRAIAVSDDLALLGISGEAHQLHLVDLQNPASPALLSAYATEEEIRAIQIVGTQAYVAAGSQGVLVLDISDPHAPVLLHHYPVYALDVWLANDGYLYIASGNNGALVFKPFQKQFPRE